MIAVIGAGITGLVIATELKKARKEVQLFDSRSTPGGNIRSQKMDPYFLELGPNSLVLNDPLHAFLEKWNLQEHIVRALPTAKYRFILKNGKYRKLPSSPLNILLNRTFSFKAKRQLLKERNLPSQNIENETIDAFFRRRIGDEWTDYAVYPFISGVFAGDPRQLLIQKAFPRIHQLEQEQGSLLRGMVQNRKNQQHRGTISLEGGLQKLIDTLHSCLGDSFVPDSPLLDIRQNAVGFTIQFKHQAVIAKQIILALPAHRISRLVQEMDPSLSTALSSISYPPVTMVFSAYKQSEIKHTLNGFGALHNQKENSYALGTIFNSSVFPGRCPADQALMTTFVGGALHPEKAMEDDEDLKGKVHRELSQFLDIRSRPIFQHIQRWPKAIPQYDLNILPVHQKADSLEKKGIYLTGNWKGGISVPDSIQEGLRMAEKLIQGDADKFPKG